MFDEREHTKPLRVPKRVSADYWLNGYKAGYLGAGAQPPRGKANAETYWRGYGEGQQDRARAGQRAAQSERELLPLRN